MSRSQHERLRIAVDLDGVLAETMEAWCNRANEFLGTSFKLADLDTWASWRKLGISREQFFQFLDEAWDDWESIPPTEPRLAEKVRKISRSGQIDVVTGRSKESVSAAKNWLAEHKILYERFVRVPGWKDKIFLNYDVYIDDAPELMPLISRNPKMWGILYSRPWNRTVLNCAKSSGSRAGRKSQDSSNKYDNKNAREKASDRTISSLSIRREETKSMADQE